MDLYSLEVAPACELVMLRTSGTPEPIGADSEIARGSAFDDEGPVHESDLTVLLEAGGEQLAELPIRVRLSGFHFQVTAFEAPAVWDEAWLTDGRVRVRYGKGGPAGRVNGLVWK